MKMRYMVLYTSSRREGVHCYASFTNRREAQRAMRRIATTDYGATSGDTAFLVEVVAEKATP